VYGFKLLKELYLKADPHYEGRYTVPTLWDKKRQELVEFRVQHADNLAALIVDDGLLLLIPQRRHRIPQ
jgi:hypothetical protein